MFDNSERYKVYKFSIPLGDILSPYWYLYYKMYKTQIFDVIQLPKPFDETINNLNEAIETQQIVKEGEGEQLSKEKLDELYQILSQKVFDLLVNCVSSEIFTPINFQKILGNKFEDKILAIFHDDNFLIITENCDVDTLKEYWVKFLKKFNPIGIFIKYLDPKIPEEELEKLTNKGLYETVITQSLGYDKLDTRIENAPIYPFSCLKLNIEEDVKTQVDKKSYSINTRLFQKIYPEQTIKDDYKLFCLSKKPIDSILSQDNEAFLLDKLIIPIKANFMSLCQPDIQARWIEFRSKVYNKVEKDEDSIVKTHKRYKKANIPFLQNMKKEYVSTIFSHLENNLFLDYHTYKNETKDIINLFEEVTLVSGLEELHNYEIFSGKPDKSPVFVGFHKKDKAGSTSYNLLHYMTHEGDKVKNKRNLESPTITSCRKVFVLKSDHAFYYLERYYEDFFSDALLETKASLGYIDFIANPKVSYDGRSNEIDIIVFNGVKLFFIELKTTLSLEYIIQYKDKCNAWMEKHLEIIDNIDFMIFGAYGKNVLEVCNLEDLKEEGYNVSIDGLNGMAYDFKIPLNHNKQLRCITQSSFEKLKIKLHKEFRSEK